MRQNLQHLRSQFSEIPGLTFDDEKGLVRLTLVTPECQLQVFLQGAHVSHFQSLGQEPLLFMSEKARYEEETPIRGGIPLIFPWFGPRRDRPNSGAHGFARNLEWKLTQVQTSPETMVVLELTSSDRTKLEWGHDFRLRLYIYPEKSLTLSWEIENLGERAFPFEAALHTYFRVSNARHCCVLGLDGARYLDHLGPEPIEQQGPINFEAETDRIYFNVPETLYLNDKEAGTQIEISSNALSSIVWNPWVDKARRMEDFGDEEWPSMVCIESGAVRDNEIHLLPGETVILAATYIQAPLADSPAAH